MKKYNAFVGLDVHKDSIAVAVAEQGQAGEVRYLGEIANTPDALLKLLRKMQNRCFPKQGVIGVVELVGPVSRR